MNIIDVNANNVEAMGFFCYMSKRTEAGFQRKMNWIQKRFAEGMKLKMLELPDRGFIEYIPGEYCWRAVDAKGYMFIHCLWVVGKSRGKGYAKALLGECLRDAEKAGMKGVVMVSNEKGWLVKRKYLEKHGFECVDEAAPSFSLMVKKFKKASPPSFIDNTGTIRRKFKDGLTVIRTDQCPYNEDATAHAVRAAKKAGIKCRIVELQSAEEVRDLSPSPYGTFGIVQNGELLRHHYMLEKDLLPLLRK